jgi:hypothetical protein
MLLTHGLRSAGYRNITALNYVTNSSIDRSLSTASFTFSNISIGAADSNRIVVFGVGVFAANTSLGSLGSITVNGNAATQIAVSSGLTNTSRTYIYAAAVPTGTTANFVVSHSVATTCGIAIYRMISRSLQLTPFATGVGAAEDATSPVTASVNTSFNGAVVSIIYGINNGTTTWTGLTEDFEVDTRSGEVLSGASVYPSTGSTLNISATKSTASGTVIQLAAASWA